MRYRKAMVGAVALSLVVGGSGAALAAGSAAAPTRTTIKQSTSFSFKPNRYIKDGLRWNKDVYHVRHNGTLVLKWNARDEGQHTFSVVRKKDLPTTNKAFNNCFTPKGVCGKLAFAHGADPNDENAPPKFIFLENGKGQDTPPDIDRPGDSVGIGFSQPFKPISVKVTAKKGTVLHFLCLIHPWMQAKVVVG